MEQEVGAVVEKVVRRSGISIAELARRIHVDRRSIYYWFKQDALNADIIFKIGNALDYDFSADFPDLIKNYAIESAGNKYNPPAEHTVHFWKHKYITLLEKYNELLVHIHSE